MALKLLVAKTADMRELTLLSNLANRHGLITGATGTGKTVTLQKLAESFSRIGVPVFMADIKGDLSGIMVEGEHSPKFDSILEKTGYSDWNPSANPVVFWDVFGESGHPVRATVSVIGPLLLADLLALNEVQTGILNIVFKVADDHGLLLIDLKDLRTMVQFVSDHAKDLQSQYGNIAQASIGAIQRGLLNLEMEEGARFLGEPMLDIFDFMRVQNIEGSERGMINILSAEKLFSKPKLYAIFLLWLLSELYERLPEVGDLDKPKIVFFFDEAHLLFKDAPKALLIQIEQVVRLIRSKGVGIYFVSQNPSDIPDMVLGQLGNRIQHALRAFTPKDQKDVKAAAQTMRTNPNLDTVEAILNLGTGEALVSFLDEKGAPTMVERAFILAPESKMGPIEESLREKTIKSSLFYGRYEEMVDRESAFERLQKEDPLCDGDKGIHSDKVKKESEKEKKDSGLLGDLKEVVFGSTGPRGGKKDGLVQVAGKTFIRKLSNGLARGILGGRKRK